VLVLVAGRVTCGSSTACTGANRNNGTRASTNVDPKTAAATRSSGDR
jgi:ribose 5-phosphate isomerase RpiB